MPLWGSTDEAANSVISAPMQFNLAPNTANRDALFGNTTADAFRTGATVSMQGASAGEMLGESSGIASITVDVQGTGYLVRPTVTIAEFDADAGVNATATAVGAVVSATANNPGTGGNAIPGDVLTVAGGTGNAATMNVTHTEIRTVAIAVAGTGYANGNVVSPTTGAGTQATFTVTTGAADTIPASLALTTRGEYTTNPTLAAAPTTNVSGSGAGLTVNLTTRVKTLAVLEQGAYTALPTINANAITGGGATGVTVALVFGVGNTVTITEDGAGYTVAPAVTFGGSGGVDTEGTAVLRAGARKGVAHAGWQLRTEGSGGRAGRVHYETLVAMGTMTGDADDDTSFPE